MACVMAKARVIDDEPDIPNLLDNVLDKKKHDVVLTGIDRVGEE